MGASKGQWENSTPQFTRNAPERITLKNLQFARFVSRRTGVSSKALNNAVRLLAEGLHQALAEGYDVQIPRLGTFQVREHKGRMRWHRLNKEMYMAGPFCMLHFKKALPLKERVREISKNRFYKVTEEPTIPPAKGK